MNKKLLEVYIKHIVDESLKSTFIDPFTDIVKTAAYGIEDLSARTQTLFKTIVKGLPTLFVPFLDYDYKSFREEEKSKLEKIKNKYADVLARNDEVFKNSDLLGIAFLLEPQVMIGAKLLSRAPEAALRVLEILSGGSELLKNLRQRVSLGPGHKVPQDSGSGYGGYDDFGLGEAVDPQTAARQQLSQSLKTLLNDKKFLAQIAASPIVKNMRQDAINIVVDRVARFFNIKSFDELKSKEGSKFSRVDTNIEQQLKNVPPEELEDAKQSLLAQMKEQYRTFYISKLNELIRNDPTLKPIVDKSVNKIRSFK